MRRTITALLIILLLSPDVPAQNNRDWKSVKKLKPDTPVLIWLWSGEDLRGNIESVSDTGLRLDLPDRMNSQVSWQRAVDRSAVRKIIRLRDLPNLPDAHKWMVTGAAIGAGVGLVAGIANKDNGVGPLGALIGLLGGAMIGDMAAGLVGIGEATPSLFRHSKVVYEDTGLRPSPPSPQSH